MSRLIEVLVVEDSEKAILGLGTGDPLKDAGTGSVNAARWRTPLYESIKRPTSLVAYGILMKYLKA